MTAQPLLPFGTVTLNPTPDRRVIHLQTAFGEQLFDIAERQRVPKIPAHGTKNQLRRRLPPLEDYRSGYVLHDLFRLPAAPAKVATHPSYEGGSQHGAFIFDRRRGSTRICRYFRQKRGIFVWCVLGRSDCWRICSRRVVAYPARVGHRDRFILRLAMVERWRIGLDHQQRRHPLADHYPNHRFGYGWLSRRPTAHEMGHYSHGRSVFS